MNYEVAERTFADRGKASNGDAVTHAVVANGAALLVMVADGVGSRPCDWLASQTACRRAVEFANTAESFGADPAGSLVRLANEIDREISATTGRGRGMMCAAAIALWPVGTDTACLANIGDTRIYRFADPVLRQVSEDDSQAIIRRGPDGRPLLSGGAAVVQRGITNALGSGCARPEVQSVPFLPGEAIVLSSDGFYGISPDFEQDMVQLLCHGDLEDALALVGQDYSQRNRDDASVAILRRRYRPLVDAELACAVDRGELGGCPRHAIAAAIADRLPGLIMAQDQTRCSALLEYLDRNQVLLGKRRVEGLLSQMGAVKWADRRSLGMLVAMLRQQS